MFTLLNGAISLFLWRTSNNTNCMMYIKLWRPCKIIWKISQIGQIGRGRPGRHNIASSCSPLVVRPWDLVVENIGVISAPQRGVVATPRHTNPLHVRLVNNFTDLGGESTAYDHVMESGTWQADLPRANDDLEVLRLGWVVRLRLPPFSGLGGHLFGPLDHRGVVVGGS